MEETLTMWFKVDDRLHSHPKAIQAGDAMALWVMAGSWCADHLTDGFVPAYMAARLMGTKGPAMAATLVRVGLWTGDRRSGQDGYAFHQWEEMQPTRDAVREQRESAAKRQADWRERKRRQRERNGVTGDVTSGVTQGVIDGVTDGLRAQTRAAVDPTRPEKNNYNLASLGATSAQTIVGEWIDRCDKRPPKTVVGQMAKHIGQMLDEGIDADDIRRGVSAWMAKGVHPSVLPSVVNEVMNGGRRNGAPSRADQRVAETLALAEQFREADALDAAAERKAIEQ